MTRKEKQKFVFIRFSFVSFVLIFCFAVFAFTDY